MDSYGGNDFTNFPLMAWAPRLAKLTPHLSAIIIVSELINLRFYSFRNSFFDVMSQTVGFSCWTEGKRLSTIRLVPSIRSTICRALVLLPYPVPCMTPIWDTLGG